MVLLSRGLTTLGLVCSLAYPAKAQAPTVVEGRITDSLRQPILDAEVSVQSAAERQIAHTNSTGSYRAVLFDGAASVVLLVRKIGYVPVRWTARASSAASRIVADTMLRSAPFKLPDLFATTNHIATPSDRLRPAVGGTENLVITRRLILNQAGDLNELLDALGQTSVTDSGSSLLGAPADQNAVVVDGMRADARLLPPDAIAAIRYASTTADVAHSQNPGAELDVTLKRGSNTATAVGRAAYSDPRVAWTDPASPFPASRQFLSSGAASGPIPWLDGHFFASWTAMLQSQPLRSILDAPEPLLAERGLALDSITSISTALSEHGIPLRPSRGVGSDQTLDAAGFFSVDWEPGSTNRVTLSAWPTWHRESGGGVGTAAYPTTAVTRRDDVNRYSLTALNYLGGFVNDFRAAVTRSSRRTEPLLATPTGSVLIGTVFDTAQSGSHDGAIRRWGRAE